MTKLEKNQVNVFNLNNPGERLLLCYIPLVEHLLCTEHCPGFSASLVHFILTANMEACWLHPF